MNCLKSIASSCVIAASCAIAAPARAQDASCKAAVGINGVANTLAPLTRVGDYQPVYQQCASKAGETRVAIRRMTIDTRKYLLTVDPATLSTHLEADACWTCADTTDEAQKDTRYSRALEASKPPPARQTAALRGALPAARSESLTPTYSARHEKDVAASSVLRNAGLAHGAADGSFITGDLCPSLQPLDRGFFEWLAQREPSAPIALSISGLWLTHHFADFQWLRDKARAGALAITWVNHSFHHPYVAGVPLASNFLLTPGVNMENEIFDTERLLIANGETPSVFFRFPGLTSDASELETLRRHHLVSLGADGWLVFMPPLRAGAILLVHPNGNERAGLRLFSKLMDKGALPQPFRAINEAP